MQRNASPDQPVSRLIVAVMNDLIFQAKIAATCRAAGVEFRAVRNVRDIPKVADDADADLILFDLNTMQGTIEEADVLNNDGTHCVDSIGFVSHVDSKRIEEAKLAGLEKVMPRSKFSAELERIVADVAEGRSGRRAGG